jgi:hypothetical protein
MCEKYEYLETELIFSMTLAYIGLHLGLEGVEKSVKNKDFQVELAACFSIAI